MGKERKFNEELLLLYKENEDPDLFEKIINDPDLKKYLHYVCRQKLRDYPSSLLGLEDFVNIAYLVLWQCIQKYRFICPYCNIQAKSEGAYKIHMLAKHNEYADPSVSITRYIKFNLGAYLQNELRREYSNDRQTNIMTVNIFSPDSQSEMLENNDNTIQDRREFEIASKLKMEDEVIFEHMMDILIESFDPFTREIFIYLYKYKMKQREIASVFHEQGRYSSEQSAAVVVSRTIKSKIGPELLKVYNQFAY